MIISLPPAVSTTSSSSDDSSTNTGLQQSNSSMLTPLPLVSLTTDVDSARASSSPGALSLLSIILIAVGACVCLTLLVGAVAVVVARQKRANSNNNSNSDNIDDVDTAMPPSNGVYQNASLSQVYGPAPTILSDNQYGVVEEASAAPRYDAVDVPLSGFEGDAVVYDSTVDVASSTRYEAANTPFN
jgi:hypothetical protein